MIYIRFEGCRRSVWEAGFLGPADRQSRVENSVISIYYVTEVADYQQSRMTPMVLV